MQSKRFAQRQPIPAAVTSIPEPGLSRLAPDGQNIAALRAEDRSSGGMWLPTDLQTAQPARLGHQFSATRIFPDARSADALGARAYTHGADIYIGHGQFAPETGAGRQLLTHELAHVAQQQRAQPPASTAAAEEEARAVAREPQATQLLTPAAQEPGVQLEPLSRADAEKRAHEIEQRLANPNIPLGEAANLSADLAGLRRTLGGAEHDPASYDGAGFILQQASLILRPDNVNGHWTPMDAQPVPADYRMMLWQLWFGISGYETDMSPSGRRAEIGADTQFEYLRKGLQAAQRLLKRVEAGGEPARDWVKRNFWDFYYQAEASAYLLQAREITKQAAAATTVAPDLRADDEQIKGAVVTANEVLNRLVSLYARFQGGQMESQITKALEQLSAAKDPAAVSKALEGVKSMPFTQGVFYLRGILNTISAVYAIQDMADRQKEAARHPNLFATGTDVLWQTSRILEGTIAFTSLYAASIAKVAGMASEVAPILALGSRSLRTVGQIGAVFQALYGFTVLLDPDSSPSQRRGALFNIGMGAAGAGSVPVLFGGTRLWASGPWTVAVIWGALLAQFGRAMQASIMQSVGSFHLKRVLWVLEDRANLIAGDGRELAVALDALTLLPAPSGEHPEASLTAGMTTVMQQTSDSLRERLKRTFERGTGAYREFLSGEVADFGEIRDKFVPLAAELTKAKTPEEIMALALKTLEVIRDIFQNAEQILRNVLKAATEDSLLMSGTFE